MNTKEFYDAYIELGEKTTAINTSQDPALGVISSEAVKGREVNPLSVYLPTYPNGRPHVIQQYGGATGRDGVWYYGF